VKLAIGTAACPIDFDKLKATVKEKFGYEMVLGTHGY